MTRTEVTEYHQGNGNLTLQTDIDPFLAYAQANGMLGGGGQFLSYKNGEWLYGMNKEVLPLGTKLAVNMLGMRVGWRRWEGGQVVDDRTSLVVELKPQPPRPALGDNDKSLWDMFDGRPRDPWQLTSIVEMVSGGGEKYIYPATSFGGRKCLTELCETFGRERRLRPGQLPIVALGADSYIHKDYGKTWEPKLVIVGWADEDTLEPVDDVPPLPPAAEDPRVKPEETAQAKAAADPDEPPFGLPKAQPQPGASPEARQPAAKPAEKRTPRF